MQPTQLEDEAENHTSLVPQVGARRLRNTCLGYLAKLKEEATTELCLDQFRGAACMTDSISALSALASIPGAARDEALSTFYQRAKANGEKLVIDKWFSVQAMADTPTALADVSGLMEHEAFDATNPNTFRCAHASPHPLARTRSGVHTLPHTP